MNDFIICFQAAQLIAEADFQLPLITASTEATDKGFHPLSGYLRLSFGSSGRARSTSKWVHPSIHLSHDLDLSIHSDQEWSGSGGGGVNGTNPPQLPSQGGEGMNGEHGFLSDEWFGRFLHACQAVAQRSCPSLGEDLLPPHFFCFGPLTRFFKT